jgi:hypothetical protein
MWKSGDFFASCSNCDIGPPPVSFPDPLVTTLICQSCGEGNGASRKAELELSKSFQYCGKVIGSRNWLKWRQTPLSETSTDNSIASTSKR